MGFCKFIRQYKEISYDGGITWHKVNPLEIRYNYLSWGLSDCNDDECFEGCVEKIDVQKLIDESNDESNN